MSEKHIQQTDKETWQQIREGKIKAEPWLEAYVDSVYSCMMPKETPLFRHGGSGKGASRRQVVPTNPRNFEIWSVLIWVRRKPEHRK